MPAILGTKTINMPRGTNVDLTPKSPDKHYPVNMTGNSLLSLCSVHFKKYNRTAENPVVGKGGINGLYSQNQEKVPVFRYPFQYAFNRRNTRDGRI